MQRFSKGIGTHWFVGLILLIGQACSGGNEEEKSTPSSQAVNVDTTGINEVSNDTNQNVFVEKKDTIEGTWKLTQRFTEADPSDTLFDPATTIEIEHSIITKTIDSQLIFVDTLTYSEGTRSFLEYKLTKRYKDFLLYSKKYNTIRFFIGGQDGTREIYKRAK